MRASTSNEQTADPENNTNPVMLEAGDDMSTVEIGINSLTSHHGRGNDDIFVSHAEISQDNSDDDELFEMYAENIDEDCDVAGSPTSQPVHNRLAHSSCEGHENAAKTKDPGSDVCILGLCHQKRNHGNTLGEIQFYALDSPTTGE